MHRTLRLGATLVHVGIPPTPHHSILPVQSMIGRPFIICEHMSFLPEWHVALN